MLRCCRQALVNNARPPAFEVHTFFIEHPQLAAFTGNEEPVLAAVIIIHQAYIFYVVFLDPHRERLYIVA